MSQRRIVWFSCGAASAMAAWWTVANSNGPIEIVYCDVSLDEHQDNRRFLKDVEGWILRPIGIIRSKKYASVDDVFTARKYMSGPKGAPCTVELKKVPRFNFQRPDDIHIFGFTAEETKRRDSLVANNPELHFEW